MNFTFNILFPLLDREIAAIFNVPDPLDIISIVSFDALIQYSDDSDPDYLQ